MIDTTYIHALYWLLMNNDILLLSFSMLLSLVTLLSSIKIIKSWGD